MCLSQGHIAVTPMRLEPAAPRSRVKHATTEPLHFKGLQDYLKITYLTKMVFIVAKRHSTYPD